MRKIFYSPAIAAIILLSLAFSTSAQEYAQARIADYMQLSCAIQVSSTISDGKYTPEEIAKIASEEGIDVLILTDRDIMSWEYGILPWRNILKKRIEERSVFSYGIKKYLRRIDDLQRAYPGMLIIPGIETAPYYYWQGSPWNGDMAIKDWHKHLLVIGMADAAALEYLPVIGNPRGLMMPWSAKSIICYGQRLCLF